MTTALPKLNPAPVSGLRSWRCRGRVLELGGEPVIMGILNVTPDSFFDGGRHQAVENAVAQAGRMVAEGAAIIDVGGQSTRPGFVEVSADEEIERVVPVIAQLVRRIDVTVSIDTYKPAVAEAALQAGAHILNDIHGLQGGDGLAQIAARHGVGVAVMHHDVGFRETEGDPLAHMKSWFERSLKVARAAGLDTTRIVLDPGIGFFKTPAQNLEILGRLAELRTMGCPLLLGASRKSFIGHVLGDESPEERLEGTLASTALAVWQGVEILRVHDVRANVRAARLAYSIRQHAGSSLSS